MIPPRDKDVNPKPAFYSYLHRWRAAYYLDPSLGIRSDGIACAFGLYVRCIRYDKEN